MATICTKCNQNPAKHQTAVNVNGRLYYMSLCDDCFLELQDNSNNTNNLDQYSKDLTAMAKSEKLDPVIGRDNEIERLIHILCRRTKNNPVLIGDPGVGKTAIVEGLAQRIQSGRIPEPLKNRRLVSLDLAAMLSGSVHRGSFEKKLKDVLDEVIQAQGQIILFLDEIHTLVGAGSAQGSIDAANILKPYLARGELQLIGATTLKEYRTVEKDAALERRFQPIIVNEPSYEYTIKILEGLKRNYEDHHKIHISTEAINDAVKFSTRYISDRFLPDKAIDLIDEAGAALRLQISSREPENIREVKTEIENLEKAISAEKNVAKRDVLKREVEKHKMLEKDLTEIWIQTKLEEVPELKSEHIALVVSKSTGIPITELTKDEKTRLKNLSFELNAKVIGQEEAVDIVSKAVLRARAGVKDQKRPIGIFMFLGPTGVGKTQLAKSLAESLYGSEENLIRVDMSEFNEKHNVARLIGSPPGYVGYEEGGQLTERVRRKPFSIILFDEIEKAHPDVFNTLLQVMDDGLLTDGHGRAVDFKNTIIIMTSNVGSGFLNRENIGFNGSETLEQAEIANDEKIARKVNDALKGQFKPEFLNRIDDVIIFGSLSKKDIREIVEKEIRILNENVSDGGYTVEFTDQAKEYLAENGYNLEMGARPLKRLIQKEIENKLSELIIDERLKSGDKVEISSDGKILNVEVKEPSSVSIDAA
jgi:ATP-dependent Clp protease ATP-binding subunit ClpC